LDKHNDTDEDDTEEPDDDHDNLDDEKGVADDDDLDDISHSDVEEHDGTSEEKGLDTDNLPLVVLKHSRALLAKGDDQQKVGLALLPKLVLVRVLDGHRAVAVGLVTLAPVAGQALPLIEHLALGLGPDTTWIYRPLRDERQIPIPWHSNKLSKELEILT